MSRRAAALLALVALAAATGSASGAPTRERAESAHLGVLLPVPKPGDVVLARVVLRGRPGLGTKVTLKLRAVNADKLAPWITAVGGVVGLHRRPLKFVSAIAIVNKRQPGDRIPPGTHYQTRLAIELLDSNGAALDDTKKYFKIHVRIARDILTRFGQPDQQPLHDLFQPVDADADTPIQRAIARGFPVVPLAGFPARTTSSRRDTAPPNVILADVADVGKSACANDASHTEDAKKKTEGDLATKLAPVASTPASEKRCDLSRYSFKSLKLSYSVAGASYSVSGLGGSVCGDPLQTAWSIAYTSTGVGNGPRARSSRPRTRPRSKPGTFPGGSSFALKLQYLTEDDQTMKLSGVAKGQVTKVVASPAQAAVTSTAVSDC